MTIAKEFTLPDVAKNLALSEGPSAKLFLCFVSSADPVTKQPWCPDVRVALPVLDAAFSASDAPELAIIEVGQRPEWKAANKFRSDWDVHFVPTLVRYERVNGEIKEIGRLVESELLDEKKLSGLIN